MKQLVLRNTHYERFYRALGLVCLVMAIVLIILGNKKDWSSWLQLIAMLLLAFVFISLNYGTMVSRMTAYQGVLTIRWYSRPGRIIVRIDEIEEILTDEGYIRIITKSGKTVRLPVRMLDFDEKHAARKFLKETTGY